MTETCVSLSTGTLSPDQRVNYAYGMVLGVDDFLTEQQHRLESGYRHARALHGYGTVYGLQVTTETSAGAPDDVTVMVTTGMAIDQWGRDVVLTCPQCARLGVWLAAQEQAGPGIVAEHRGPSGELVVYVVARYASCLDALVPLPGQPCSSSAPSMVASRIRDAWDVDLTFDPPPMPRWDTDRRLARLLSSVKIVSGLPSDQSSEEAIVAAVLALVAEASDGPGSLETESSPPSSPPGDTGFQLPADQAADALDRIMTVWVTQVRPLLEPDLTQPQPNNPSAMSDEAILLASVTFTAADPFDPLAPRITSFDQPDNTGRPYVLHTRLIQELRSLQGTATVVVQPQELVTLAPSVDPSGTLTLDAWFHLPDPVSLTEGIEVVTEAGVRATFDPAATDDTGNLVQFSDVWRLTAPGDFTTVDGQQLEARFDAETVFIGNDSTTLAEVQADGLDLLNANLRGDVRAFATVEIDPVSRPEPPPVETKPSMEFVTTTSASVDNEQLWIEMWFHPQPRGPRDDVLLTQEPTVEAFDELTGNPLERLEMRPHPVYRNVWAMNTRVPENQQPFPAYVRLVFVAEKIFVQTPAGDELTLAEWITKDEIVYVGWDPREALIVSYTRVAGRG